MFQEDGRSHYQSYILRLWRPDDLSPWQGSLQDTASGEVHHFAEPDALWAFLLQAMEIGPEPPPETPRT
jgi:hypothetical protein